MNDQIIIQLALIFLCQLHNYKNEYINSYIFYNQFYQIIKIFSKNNTINRKNIYFQLNILIFNIFEIDFIGVNKSNPLDYLLAIYNINQLFLALNKKLFALQIQINKFLKICSLFIIKDQLATLKYQQKTNILIQKLKSLFVSSQYFNNLINLLNQQVKEQLVKQGRSNGINQLKSIATRNGKVEATSAYPKQIENQIDVCRQGYLNASKTRVAYF
ncbi:hypothetical protein TTHERM_001138234 (macronuclear) [Tetrahymena thermophila SB210]|uniref:Uncharacterized protein n=1 Tax=Tetrahymena thermophila (strain SB210) TaxID=312017 RepID=W7XA41_TETTS|nr:hypothetical protein TTHERM_001138234 [Tetrahymena thermophila SB210]EWS76265.1 hypothetical protein TTHERM_001138234 [Tetrahymena thermophila SB210]|eukprot:XP_012651194.1 hypothetical protein TTHERM_001138234 [Tetrahymena thermophila SB210]